MDNRITSTMAYSFKKNKYFDFFFYENSFFLFAFVLFIKLVYKILLKLYGTKYINFITSSLSGLGYLAMRRMESCIYNSSFRGQLLIRFI